jgi:hypothetical protein
MDCGSLFSCLVKLHLRGQSRTAGQKRAEFVNPLLGKGLRVTATHYVDRAASCKLHNFAHPSQALANFGRVVSITEVL